MNIDALSGSSPNVLSFRSTAPETAETQRKKNQEQAPEPQSSQAENQVQPEELLDSIKSITQDGRYSVRFEQYKESNELIVKITDNETDEVIREIPPRELIDLKLSFEELRGNLLNKVA
ncbi:MAG: flagellar protein FlaG [Desulfopila sp.]